MDKKRKDKLPAGRLPYTPTAIGVNYIELEGNLMGTASVKLKSGADLEDWEDGGDLTEYIDLDLGGFSY
ncbi:MAG: hypothetical protein LBR48_03115 [Dysgonamonadaceae bacterium]|jgi:hypothetical protein|nr:hypothetical protein [Dysgonamonadaceae bacterium]